jgi:hypothetical protein
VNEARRGNTVCNSSTWSIWEVEVGGSRVWVWGHLELYNKNLCQKKTERRETENELSWPWMTNVQKFSELLLYSQTLWISRRKFEIHCILQMYLNTNYNALCFLFIENITELIFCFWGTWCKKYCFKDSCSSHINSVILSHSLVPRLTT